MPPSFSTWSDSLSYCTVSEARENTTLSHTVITSVTGTDLTLPDTYTFDIDSVKKNGVTVASSGYNLILPRTLRMTSSFIATDYFEIDRSILLSDAEVTAIITDADRMIDSYISKAYALPFSTTPPYINTISKKISRSMILKRLSTHSNYNVNALQLEESKNDMEYCKKYLEGLRDGEYELVDSSGVVISRKSNYGELTAYVSLDDSTEVV